MSHHFLESFVRDGFVQLQVPADEVPASVHALIAERAHALAAARERRSADRGYAGDEIDRNLLALVPELAHVLGCRTVRAAVRALLGARARLAAAPRSLDVLAPGNAACHAW